MTSTDKDLSGEARYRARRTRMLRYVALLTASGLVLGAIMGYSSQQVEDGSVPAWVIVAFLGVSWVVAGWLSWDFYHRTDELDMADNLWASLFGLSFYLAALPTWYALHDTGIAPPPEQWTIFIATMAVFFLTYLARKLGLR